MTEKKYVLQRKRSAWGDKWDVIHGTECATIAEAKAIKAQYGITQHEYRVAEMYIQVRYKPKVRRKQ